MHRNEQSGDELAVHPVSHSSMSRNDGVEIFDAVSALDRTRPEPAERRDDRGERGHGEGVKLNGGHRKRSCRRPEKEKHSHEGTNTLRLCSFKQSEGEMGVLLITSSQFVRAEEGFYVNFGCNHNGNAMRYKNFDRATILIVRSIVPSDVAFIQRRALLVDRRSA